MSDAMWVAIIGGGAGIITALSTVGFKIYDYYRQRKEKTLEERIAELEEKLGGSYEERKETIND